MSNLVKTCLFALLFLGTAHAAQPSSAGPAASPTDTSEVLTPSGLPVPRFVNLKHDQTWGRVGPSKDYPVRYEFNRRGLPLKVIAETRDNSWRKVQDPDGETMWIHRSQLISSNRALVKEDDVYIRTKPSESASVRAKLQAGVIVRFSDCTDLWCTVEAGGFKGYATRQAFWGIDLSN